MNLDSIEDLTLLRNCTIMKLIELNSNKNELNSPTIQESISDFSELLKSLRAGDLEGIHQSLLSTKSEDFSNFTKYILETPTREIKENFSNLSKEMLSKGIFSPEQLEKFSKLFDTASQKEDSQPASPDRTDSMQTALNKFNTLIKQNNPRTISATQFKDLAAQFRDITKFLGMSKFQQYFDESGQTITDMQISYDSSQYDQTVYKTDFTLSSPESKEDHLIITKPAPQSDFISDYYQNLCYTYLEALKYSKINDDLLDAEVIKRQMDIFSECYKRLEAMSNHQINIIDNKVIFSGKTEFEPEPEHTIETLTKSTQTQTPKPEYDFFEP